MGNCPVNQRFSKNFVVLWYISFDIALKASAMEKNTVDSSHMARTLLQKQSALVHRNVVKIKIFFTRTLNRGSQIVSTALSGKFHPTYFARAAQSNYHLFLALKNRTPV